VSNTCTGVILLFDTSITMVLLDYGITQVLLILKKILSPIFLHLSHFRYFIDDSSKLQFLHLIHTEQRNDNFNSCIFFPRMYLHHTRNI